MPTQRKMRSSRNKNRLTRRKNLRDKKTRKHKARKMVGGTPPGGHPEHLTRSGSRGSRASFHSLGGESHTNNSRTPLLNQPKKTKKPGFIERMRTVYSTRKAGNHLAKFLPGLKTRLNENQKANNAHVKELKQHGAHVLDRLNLLAEYINNPKEGIVESHFEPYINQKIEHPLVSINQKVEDFYDPVNQGTYKTSTTTNYSLQPHVEENIKDLTSVVKRLKENPEGALSQEDRQVLQNAYGYYKHEGVNDALNFLVGIKQRSDARKLKEKAEQDRARKEAEAKKAANNAHVANLQQRGEAVLKNLQGLAEFVTSEHLRKPALPSGATSSILFNPGSIRMQMPDYQSGTNIEYTELVDKNAEAESHKLKPEVEQHINLLKSVLEKMKTNPGGTLNESDRNVLERVSSIYGNEQTKDELDYLAEERQKAQQAYNEKQEEERQEKARKDRPTRLEAEGAKTNIYHLPTFFQEIQQKHNFDYNLNYFKQNTLKMKNTDTQETKQKQINIIDDEIKNLIDKKFSDFTYYFPNPLGHANEVINRAVQNIWNGDDFQEKYKSVSDPVQKRLIDLAIIQNYVQKPEIDIQTKKQMTEINQNYPFKTMRTNIYYYFFHPEEQTQ